MNTPGRHVEEHELLDLVLGAATRPARADALRHARHCPECERRFLDLVRERELARLRPAPVWRDGNIEAPGAREETVVPPSITRRRHVVAAASAAAAFLAVLGAAWYACGRSVADAPYRPPVIASSLAHREVGSELRTSFETAVIEAYRSGNDARVIELFRVDPFSGARPDLVLLLAGAQAARQDVSAAAETLRALDISTLPQPWRDHARHLHYDVCRAAGRDQQADLDLLPLSESSVPGMREFAVAEASARRVQLPTRMKPPQ